VLLPVEPGPRQRLVDAFRTCLPDPAQRANSRRTPKSRSWVADGAVGPDSSASSNEASVKWISMSSGMLGAAPFNDDTLSDLKMTCWLVFRRNQVHLALRTSLIKAT